MPRRYEYSWIPIPIWLLGDLVQDVRSLRPVELAKDLARFVKFTYQKITRGFSDDECWNLDRSLAVWLLPRLKKLAQDSKVIGYPAELTEEKWDKILSKIIHSLEIKTSDDGIPHNQLTPAFKEYSEGIELLGKWFDALWT